ncbi:phospholipase D-like domain-containing protein [Neisseriaceae bacterium JH1-16]|nr:phospholipase D-like domain-containing protein [Neisseriaceae bacterium JH1-16]
MKTIRCLVLATLLGAQSFSFAAPSVQVGFSPEGSARKLVLNVIGSATKSIQMMGYSFTAPDIMQALVEAHARGVEVRVVIDKKRNQGKASKAAIQFVTSKGVKLRIDDHYNIQHDNRNLA